MATADESGTLKCTIIADAVTGNVLHRTGECSRRASPCSSFKIALAIMGFDSGILQSPSAPHWELNPEYNPFQRDLKFTKVYPALWQSDSVVWFAQQLTTRLGDAQFSEYVKKFEYGNQDISGDPGMHNGLTRSWLMSSLSISPKEQVQFLYRFIAHKLPVSETAYEMTRATIPQYQATGGWVVHGKSGSGWLHGSDGKEDESRPQGWFVGWAEKDGRQVVFARLEIGRKASDVPGGTKAREEILPEFHMLLDGK
ncbi:Beta-lactamase OXA-1 precursor [Candidatus Brocadiaceae bacterium B188]|nr:class D beta-lactamase [Candidatus Brocadia sapporoensis]RZV59246.1 MAG: class D beta-lactamase [Candidatus Brocadia sp. BROELEC01]TWU53756.1 Beta-lactamase OXA-1 precursor [Candidatus Brocadiaceae bacterium B188]